MALVLVLAALLICAPCAYGQAIGIYADSLGTDCRIQVPYPGPPVTAFVVATPEGIQNDGITTASFRIAGLPDGWTAEATPGPQVAVAIGDVMNEGVDIAWTSCVVSRRALLRLSITASTAIEGANLVLEAHENEAGKCFINQCGPCAKFCGCDGIPKCYCPDLFSATINGDACTVTVESGTWTMLKSVFR